MGLIASPHLQVEEVDGPKPGELSFKVDVALALPLVLKPDDVAITRAFSRIQVGGSLLVSCAEPQ